MATFRPKENARPEYLLMVMESWTYNRMTVDEKSTCLDKIITATIKGRFLQRWTQLQAVFSAYLDSIGYSGAGWRDAQNIPTEPETSEGKEDTTTTKTEPQEATETPKKTIQTGERLYSHPHRHMVTVTGLQDGLVMVIYRGRLYLLSANDLYTDESETTPAILPPQATESAEKAADDTTPTAGDTEPQRAAQTAGTSEGAETTTPPHKEPPRAKEQPNTDSNRLTQSYRRTRPAAPQSHGTTKGIQRHNRPPKTAYRAIQRAAADHRRRVAASRGSPKICISWE